MPNKDNTICEYCAAGWRVKNYRKTNPTSIHGPDICELLAKDLASHVIKALAFKAKTEGKRVCPYCASGSHKGPRCPKKFEDLRSVLLAYKARCMDFLSWIEQIGFGPGCLISSTSATQKWRKSHKDVVEKRVIAIKDFDTQWQRQSFLDSIIGSKTKNWVDVPAIDFTGETVKEIYLPFHPKWSPTPRAKKAEIVERAGEEDIKKFLDSFSFNSSPVITSANAEEFFKKFKFKGGKSCSFIKA